MLFVVLLQADATVIPPAPSVASAQTAAEQVEHYWVALLRDVPFTEYPTNPVVAAAVIDMNKLSFLSSSENWNTRFRSHRRIYFAGRSSRAMVMSVVRSSRSS